MKSSEIHALAAKRFRQPISTADKMKKFPCDECKEFGRWKSDCPKKKKQFKIQNSNGSSQTASNISLVILNIGSLARELRTKWVADSGSSQLMANNEAYFDKIEHFKNPKYASVGDGKQVAILGEGIVTLEANIDGMWAPRTLTNIAFISELATNLLSIGSAALKGVTSSFNNEKCLLKQQVVTVAIG